MYRIGPIGRKSREKCLVVLVLATLCLLCFAGIFLLPDNFGGERVIRAYKHFQKTGPEIFIPAPPLEPHGPKDKDPHFLNDRRKLEAKIKEELGEILDKPQLQRDVDNTEGQRLRVNDDSGQRMGAGPRPLHNEIEENASSVPLHLTHSANDFNPMDINNVQMPLGGHPDNNIAVEKKRLKIKEVSNKYRPYHSVTNYHIDYVVHNVEQKPSFVRS